MGLRRDIRVLADEVSLNLLGDRCNFPPKGVMGGGAGAVGSYVLNPGTDRECRLANKLSNYRMRKGDVISMRTPGGGGYGDPTLSDLKLIEHDRRVGNVTS